jgi:ABC-type transporter Mla subunit MlaD
MTLSGANQILVVMALDPNKFTPLKNRKPRIFLEHLVGEGLRVKLAAAGVTGLSFLELDYFRTDQKPEMLTPISWHPKNPYIPSSPSTMFSFKKALDDVFVKLSQVNIQGLGDEALKTLHMVQEKLNGTDVAELAAQTTALMRELRETNRSVQSLVSSPDIQKLPSDLSATAGSARRIAASLETQLGPLVESVHTVTEHATALADALTGVTTNASGQVQQTVSALNQTAQTLNRTAVSQQNTLAELIQNLHSASVGLDQIISELRANPSALLFSTPPQPLPETRR